MRQGRGGEETYLRRDCGWAGSQRREGRRGSCGEVSDAYVNMNTRDGGRRGAAKNRKRRDGIARDEHENENQNQNAGIETRNEKRETETGRGCERVRNENENGTSGDEGNEMNEINETRRALCERGERWDGTTEMHTQTHTHAQPHTRTEAGWLGEDKETVRRQCRRTQENGGERENGGEDESMSVSEREPKPKPKAKPKGTRMETNETNAKGKRTKGKQNERNRTNRRRHTHLVCGASQRGAPMR